MLPSTVQDKQAKVAISLDDGGSLVQMKANHRDCPRLETGLVDWNRVTRVQVVAIEVSP